MTTPDDRTPPDLQVLRQSPLSHDNDRSDADYDAVITAITNKFVAENRAQAQARQNIQQCRTDIGVCESQLERARADEVHAHDSFRAERASDDHHSPLPRQWAIAGLALIPEWYACYLGAEALGQGVVATALFATIILTVLGGCEYWYDSAVRSRNQGQKKLALSLLVATVAALGGLRFYYGWVVEGRSLLGGIGLAAALTIVTAALVGIGCAALRFSESILTWQKRKEYKRAKRAVRAAETALAHAKDNEQRAVGRFRELVMRDITEAADQQQLSERRLQQALTRHISHISGV